VSGSHGGTALDGLLGPSDTAVRQLRPQVKLLALVSFVVAVVATPSRALWAVAALAGVAVTAVVVARLPVRVLARRLVIEVPFLVFALALPLVGRSPRVELPGLLRIGPTVSVAGSWAAWGIVSKALLAGAVAVVLAWSTPVADVLQGLERLRVPRVITAIAGFMVRYADVVSDELDRLQMARVSRGDDPRWWWQGRAVAATVGATFVRSFERGERVQRAMLARGWSGSMPEMGDVPDATDRRGRHGATAFGVVVASAWATTALAICVVARVAS
jgi:cobalt/nickel transport system permease protein